MKDITTEYVTVMEAARELQRTYWQVDSYLKKHSVQIRRAGNTRLVKLTDLKGLRREGN